MTKANERRPLKEELLRETIRHVFRSPSGSAQMNSQRESPVETILSALFLIVLLGLGAVVVLLPFLIGAGLVVGVVYLVAWVSAILIAVPLTFAFLAYQAKKLKRRWKRSVRDSPIPSYDRIHEPQQFDAILWQMMDYYIGRETVGLRSRKVLTEAGWRKRNQEIKDCAELRDALLQDRELFNMWRRDNLFAVVRDEYNRSALAEIYMQIWRRVVSESTSQGPVSRLSWVVLSKMVSERQYEFEDVFQRIMNWLTFQGSRPEREERPALIRLRAEERVALYLKDGERFRRFMDQYFFEILVELGEYQIPIEGMADTYRQQQQEEQHYQPLPRPAFLQKRLLRARQVQQIAQESEALKQRHEAQKRRVQEAAEEEERWREQEDIRSREHAEELEKAARAEQESAKISRLRKKYLGRKSAAVLFHEFKKGPFAFREDIKTVVDGRAVGDENRDGLLALLNERDKFIAFWCQNEHLILTIHDERKQAERYLQRAEDAKRAVKERAQQEEEGRRTEIESAVAGAYQVHLEQAEKIKNEESMRADEEYGYLLAVARLRVEERVGDHDKEAVDQYIQRELRTLLERPDAQETYFSPQSRRAMRHCNAFLAGVLPYNIDLGLSKDDPLDKLAKAFYNKMESWAVFDLCNRYYGPKQDVPQALKDTLEQIETEAKATSASTLATVLRSNQEYRESVLFLLDKMIKKSMLENRQ